MVKQNGGLTERLVPVLLIASIGLAFIVGVLWQKVNNLSGGSTGNTTAGNQVAGTEENTAGQQAPSQPSKLDDLVSVAKAAGVDEAAFNKCVADKKYAQKVEEVYQGGVDAGITGTPGNIVLNTKGEAWLIPGALPFVEVEKIIKAAQGDTTVAASGKMTGDQVAKIPEVTDADYARGSSNPTVYLIEYSDFQCPYCKSFHPTAQQVIDTYDNVAWVYRHFPLDAIHPLARPSAEASECVAELGGDDAFWKFADEIFGA
jgi:protein-disulfide isomerase